jgi:hypothetical protein
MSAQQHEAVMQAEDPSEPPENGGNHEARSAVAKTFADILEAHHPGSTWLPIERADGNAAPRSAEIVGILTTPYDSNTLSDIPSSGSTPSDVDHVNSGRQEPLTLSRV